MFKRKILITAVLLGISLIPITASADPIIELAAPRIVPKIMPEDNAPVKPSVGEKAPAEKSKDKAKSKHKSKSKHIVHKRPVVIKVDYDKVSKMIEYGYYDQADNILEAAIRRNIKDTKALSLWTVSLAKQCKLEPAQNVLDKLLKKYPDNSNLHYAQGVVYYQRTTSSNMYYRNMTPKLISDSTKEFNLAVKLDKDNARAYNALGVISLNQNKPKDARVYFNKSLAADKTYSLAIDNLGTMDLLAGKLADAEKRFKDALTYNSQNITAMYHLAQIAMQKQDYAQALNYLNNALAIYDNSPAIYNLMGKAYLAQGNDAAAINSFKKSLQVKPEFIASYLDLANIYEKRGDSEFAIEQLKTALAIDPDFCDAKLKIADISLSNGNFNQAISVYSELVGINGYNAAALKGLASAYFEKAQDISSKSQVSSNKDMFDALDYINKAISANPQDLELHLAKLKINRLTNQPDQSKISLNKIIQDPANDLMGNVIKAEAYLTIYDYTNAQRYFDAAIKLSQNSDDDLYLSEILMYHRQYDKAGILINKVLKSDPQNSEALSDLDYIQKALKNSDNYFKSAQNFAKSKNYSTAIEYLSHAVGINPNNPQAQLLLAQLYDRDKDYAHAVSHYKAYLSLLPNAKDSSKISKRIRNLENRL